MGVLSMEFLLIYLSPNLTMEIVISYVLDIDSSVLYSIHRMKSNIMFIHSVLKLELVKWLLIYLVDVKMSINDNYDVVTSLCKFIYHL